MFSAFLSEAGFVDASLGSDAVPPIVLLAAVHGIALAVRAGASGRIYFWA